jgi:hypothetical protein
LEAIAAPMHLVIDTFLNLVAPIITLDHNVVALPLTDLTSELTHVTKYFLLRTEYREPYKMPSRHPSEKRVVGGVEI